MSRASVFLEKYPDAEVRGGPIRAVREAMGDAAAPYFARAGFENASPEGWYSMANYIQLIYGILEHEPNVLQNMVSIGMFIADHLELPPEIDTLEKGLMALHGSWLLNARNGKEWIWSVQKVNDDHFICTCSSPFPIDQEYGALYGFARKFAGGRRFNVTYEDLADRDDPDKEEIRLHVKVG